MSVTVRLWSKEDLAKIDRCETQDERYLATVFMNASTFSEEEIWHYPYDKRREYYCAWQYGDEGARVYATDDEMLKAFLLAEYTELPTLCFEAIYRPVRLHDPWL